MPEYQRILNAERDVPDTRDWLYKPALAELKNAIDPPSDLHILDQKSEGACTGFAVAAVINRQFHVAGQDTNVSPRMLYEMAKKHDEWPGEAYEGSSLRGAIHGWKNMGVCREEDWPFLVSRVGSLTIERAKQARNQTIGAYYRLNPEITDFHAALNETGAIAVSAQVHRGWQRPRRGQIAFHATPQGGHAFAIVGYNGNGFWVQNSWGTSWGDNGLALWSYEDWITNVMDAWVFRLALPTPQIFGLRAESSRLLEQGVLKEKKESVSRAKVAGHFIHIDDGEYKTTGQYWSTSDDVEQTARLVAESKKYKHLLVYVHGGLNSPKASARRIATMKNVFKDNTIYPYHIMYDTGLVEELTDLIRRKESRADERVGGVRDWVDRFIEGLMRRPGTLLWEEMKRDAKEAFEKEGAGTDAIDRFVKHIRRTGKRMQLHLAGHSTGTVVIGHMLKTMSRRQLRFKTCSLMAPACTIDLYNDAYLPVLRRDRTIRLDELTIYNLKDGLERDDNVIQIYGKSLLYLVSNAFERAKAKPLLGMERFKNDVASAGSQPTMIWSDGTAGNRTRSTTHAGFDNDVHTMNHILRRIVGGTPARPFEAEDLKY